jgi:putative SOS response-associated peptidase YedK
MTPGKSLAEQFGLAEEVALPPRYNIAPTQLIAAIRVQPDSPDRALAMLKWGLIPFWAKDSKIAFKLINARSETAAEKPAFRAAFKYRRCLIPADGFYEWKKAGARKQPYLVGMADGKPFAMAGLWEHWENPEGEVVESCTILTTSANHTVGELHDRMPAILVPMDYDVWLNPKVNDPKQLAQLLKPYVSSDMRKFPVSQRVNRATYDAPDCMEAVTEEGF